MWSGKFLSDNNTEETTLCVLTAIFSISIALLIVSCREKTPNPNVNLRLEDFSSIRNDTYALSSRRLQREVRRVAASDSDSTLADFYARSFYLNGRPYIWVSRKGVTQEADTLVEWLRTVRHLGFDAEKFRLSDIETDLTRARALDFQDGRYNINKVYARLEYNLTKALFRFSAGQRFGYTNPNVLLNSLDKRDGSEAYVTLYDLKSPAAGRRFFLEAARQVCIDSLGVFLRESEPQDPLYKRFERILNSDSATLVNRRLLLINMERCRWRVADTPWRHDKYVMVNLPSLHLMAVDGAEVLTMRIGCGSLKTKTPLLASSIKRLDINPQWIMPRSIVKKSIIPRLGNRWYFHSRHYFIRDRATGQDIEPWNASPAALLDGSQLAIQEGGEGNALGRIIFRFDNDFSIYLHDTSSRDVFGRSDRDVSHGCIRVEKPFALAAFIVGKDDSKTIDRIWYSIHADVSPLGKDRDKLTNEEKAVADTLNRKRLIGRVPVMHSVPVFIWYYTLFPGVDGRLETYQDLYGYDEVIYNQLRNYL